MKQNSVTVNPETINYAEINEIKDFEKFYRYV